MPQCMLVNEPPEWPAPVPMRTRRRGRRRLANGARIVQVAARIEPEAGRLEEFGREVARITGKPLMSSHNPEHRAIYVFWEAIAENEMRAIESCSFNLRRALRKVDIPVVRVTFDTRFAT